MTIRVYNTLSRTKEAFEPVVPGTIGMYVCGPTVYATSHVGHMVGPVVFDAIKRYLQYNGYKVTLVINITDIDDKIISQAARESGSVEELAERVTRDYLDNLRRLGVDVDHFPRATRHIPDILAIIQGLVDRGYAYAAGGDVYFDVTRAAGYGKLSNRRLDELVAGTRKEVSERKRHPGDFALWKAAKLGEPAWESCWGPGRPGWHIECSAMSMKLLGNTFDIHGGGLDLCFPHHEDEIAQSESYTGQPFARYWMHNGLMQYGDEARKIGAREGELDTQEPAKMSKSKGNVVGIGELLSRFSPETVRFFLLSTHYRRPIHFTLERVEELEKGLGRFHGLCDRIRRILGGSFYALPATDRRAELPFAADGSVFLEDVAQLRARFLEYMDDDFNSGGAIGVLFELLAAINRFADERKLEDSSASAADKAELENGLRILRELTNLLGVLREPPPAVAADGLVPRLIDALLDVRQDLRRARQFALADQIRQRLNHLGVTVEDRPAGSRWKIEEPR